MIATDRSRLQDRLIEPSLHRALALLVSSAPACATGSDGDHAIDFIRCSVTVAAGVESDKRC